MRASISTPFVDTRAEDLVWTLNHPLVEPLAARTVERPGLRVQLRVLGASHQVVVERESGNGTAPLVETVACLPGFTGGLPGDAVLPSWGLGDYRFTSTVETLAANGLSRRIDRLRAEVADSPGGLYVTFPGDPLAVTALHLAPESPLGWRTWHAYPQSGELVSTAATITP
ncbi:DUF2617 family protein [Nocardiopsis sp. FIRDI 009]|uniref:DUF2617 family protein n=1 Tax=Nocardiopsis sp. FIRDI 009 TaxID=714197 RepID=UPI000E25D147|nr:DUF2617 family protein [Nocardiopsis sp. FIRDI 009]